MEGVRPIVGVAGLDLYLDLDNHGQGRSRYQNLAKAQTGTRPTQEVELEEDPYAGYFI